MIDKSSRQAEPGIIDQQPNVDGIGFRQNDVEKIRLS